MGRSEGWQELPRAFTESSEVAGQPSRIVRWPWQSKETLERAGWGPTPTIPALKGCKFQIILGGKASSKVAQGIGEGPGSSCFLL